MIFQKIETMRGLIFFIFHQAINYEDIGLISGEVMVTAEDVYENNRNEKKGRK
jgi:hypothetical protein